MAIDFDRRRAVMARSRKLGHCICNPKHPCPCPPLIEHNVCPCAGERMPVKQGAVALTRHVRKAGCASKIGQADLHKVLSAMPPVTDPNVLVGTAAGDDAGVYKLSGDQALVQTVDVFTPCVDDAYLFGQIAAANSVSDVYAMGGRPLSALSIVGFPIDELDAGVLEQLLRGGVDKMAEAGCPVIGGHSINDEEVKMGFAVTGLIDPGKPIQRDRAEPGDLLVLTKPLGTGMVAFAAQLGIASDTILAEVGAWMAALNKDAAELMVEHGAHACTDITGFGLAGHLVSMVRGSGVDAEIDLSAAPVFAMVPECIAHEVFGGAVDRNQAYAMSWVAVGEDAGTEGLPVLYDAQTSGGLLVALPESRAEAFVEAMHGRGHEAASVIGRIVEKDASRPEGNVIITNAALAHFVGTREPIDMSRKRDLAVEVPAASEYEDVACCEDPPTLEDLAVPEAHIVPRENTMADPFAPFKEFMKSANKPGLVDAESKKLMAIALAIAHHCEPCLRIHLKGALDMGISKDAIDEAAALAVEFGGCTSMMFYREVCQSMKLG